MEYVRSGDVLVVHSIDRLARNLADLLAIVKGLNARGVAVEFCKESLSFSGDDSPSSKLMLSVMGACAEFERSMIRKRQLEGIALAKKAGVYKGRKSTMTDGQVQANARGENGVTLVASTLR
jgi:DNA invertase Pin-like site-specific DNA recombinase